MKRGEVVIVAILLMGGLTLLLPYIQQMRVRSHRTVCEMRQIHTGLALERYETQFTSFPGYRNSQATTTDGDRQPTSWAFPILPYVLKLPAELKFNEETLRYELPDLQTRTYAPIFSDYGPEGPSATRGAVPESLILEFICPADRPPNRKLPLNRMSFVVNSGLPDARPTTTAPPDWTANGIFMDHFLRSEVESRSASLAMLNEGDGADTTLLITENVDSGSWTDDQESRVGFVWVAETIHGEPDPGDLLLRINQQVGEGDGNIKFARPSSYHPGGVNVLYASQRTAFLTESIDYLIYTQLMSSNSGQLRQAGTNKRIGPPFGIIAE